MTEAVLARKPKRARARRPKGFGTIRQVRDGVWQLKIDAKAPGKGQRRTIYETVKGTRQDAEARIRALAAEREKGLRLDLSKNKLEGWVQIWLRDEIDGTVGDRTAERYRELLENHVLPVLGAKTLKELRASDFHRLYRELGEKGLAPATVKYVHTVVSSCLNDAVADQLIEANPAQLVSRRRRKRMKDKTVKAKRPKMKIIAAEQIEALIRECEEKNYQNLTPPMARLAFDSGARRGEYLAPRWNDMNFDTGVLKLCRALDETKKHGVRMKDELKNESSVRDVKLHPLTVAALKTRRDSLSNYKPDHLIFPYRPEGAELDPYQPIPPRLVTKQFARVAARLGLVGLRLHDARHNCASHMLKAGRGIPEIQARLGHANASTTWDWYVHNVPEKAWDGIGG